MEKIAVKNSGVIQLQSFNDGKDGHLVIAEAGKNLPIDVKRFYFINNLSPKTSVRGKHAHKKTEQYIFAAAGSFDLLLDDGTATQTIRLSDPKYGIRLGAGLWHTMQNFSENCVILVAANDYYDAADYIRDYAEFKAYAHNL